TGSVPADGASLNPSFYDVAGVSHTVTLGSNRNLGGLTLNSASGFTFNNAGGETLTFQSNDAQASILSARGNHVIAVPVVLNSNLAVGVASDSVSITGAISGTGGL